MVNSIYTQLSRALLQSAQQGQRSILYRGRVIACTVLVGDSLQALGMGGLQSNSTVHVLVNREFIQVGQEGDPSHFEPVTYPAVPTAGLQPAPFQITHIVAQEWCYAFTLEDPTK